MAERQAIALFESPLVQAYDVCCRARQSGYGIKEWSGVAQVVLPRRGVFVVERRGEPVVADVNTALIFGAHEGYRVSHPCDGGDDCTVLILAPQLLSEGLGASDSRDGGLGPRDQLGICLVTRALRDPAGEPVEKEEATLLLLHGLARAFATTSGANSTPIGRKQRARVEQVRGLLATSPTIGWDLSSVAQVVHCSPFHLARQFHAVTGETISRYLLRLRLGLALERLAEGERHLARLALELGFSHHSHFSSRFRTAFGLTPAAARDTLTKRRLGELRTIMTAERE